jgi:hypothetical protein
MMTTSEPTTVATVLPLRRPAVHASTLVRSDVEHTFDVFVRMIGQWWPVERMSAGHDRVRDVTLEQKTGGSVYETWDDGTTVTWGTVAVWDPPHRFTMTWDGTLKPTEVDLAFNALGPQLTRVTLEHRGWEALTDEELTQDCAHPGGYSAGGYDIGWRLVLDRFAAAAARANEREIPEITDEYMLEMLSRSLEYTAVLLAQGPNFEAEGSDKVIWEHGRRNFSLRADGVLAIVCPITDGGEWCGIYVFNANERESARIMDGDPGVRAGTFTYEAHPIRGFPGDSLPG